METRQLVRPLSSLCHATSSLRLSRSPLTPSISTAITTPSIYSTGRRHQSTTARTKKALKIAPHPDFLTQASGQNHIIYNPPSATPSVFHTPFKFLPKSDPRRQAGLAQHLRLASSSSASSSTDPKLPPVARKSELVEKKYHVTREQVEEMRALRAEDPQKWSVLNLCRKYDCTPMFVIMCCKTSPEYQARERKRREAIRARWGAVRTKAHEEKRKRRALLLQGQL
ncbi:mitochondrial ribosomal protein subunit L20-domain-containing protein [Xylariaceae sp. FL0255]|nr:mitochondrial ribosomal protein subunit L20-domain-containing protein [Xylariaceae sp. FL0255]